MGRAETEKKGTVLEQENPPFIEVLLYFNAPLHSEADPESAHGMNGVLNEPDPHARPYTQQHTYARGVLSAVSASLRLLRLLLPAVPAAPCLPPFSPPLLPSVCASSLPSADRQGQALSVATFAT